MLNFPIKKSNNRLMNPLQEIDALRHEVDQIFDLTFPGLLTGGSAYATEQWIPSIDVIDDKNELRIKADLPGMNKKDINVQVQDKHLTISGEKKSDNQVKQDHLLRTERSYGHFSRSLSLPTHVDVNKAKAKFKDGVLELTLPKKEEYQPKQIQIDID